MNKQDTLLYKPGNSPAQIEVPELTFFELAGAGSPNSPEFSDVIGTLYGLAYTVRMAPKSGLVLPGYEPFTVYPLEGIWDLSEAGRLAADPTAYGVTDKTQLVYRLMIRQPDFVDENAFVAILEQARRKKKLPLLDQVRLVRIEEGLCVQMTHIGAYDDEPASFARMKAYCESHGLRRRELTHREIYMSDPRRTSPEAMRTVLRWRVIAPAL